MEATNAATGSLRLAEIKPQWVIYGDFKDWVDDQREVKDDKQPKNKPGYWAFKGSNTSSDIQICTQNPNRESFSCLLYIEDMKSNASSG